MNHILKLLGVLMMVCVLSSCTSVAHCLASMANAAVTDTGYPPAKSKDSTLDQPPIVDLKRYKSVHTRLHQRKDMAMALTASGGGYRAANLTLGVLLGLEAMKGKGVKSGLLQEVDYFSTVSGGGLAVGYYLAQLHNHLEHYRGSGTAPDFSLYQAVDGIASHRWLQENPLRADLSEYLFFGTHRGLKLEKEINDTILYTPEGGLVLGDMFVPYGAKRPVQLPYWVINTAIYQNMVTLPFTPDVLARYQVTGYFHDNLRWKILGDFNSPEYAYRVPVAVGLTASVGMPYAVPTTTLISGACGRECYLQLIDGGLADNLGVYTALRLLLQDKSPVKVLLIIDAYKGNSSPYSANITPPDKFSMAARVATSGTDANRERVKASIHMVAKDLLCSRGASNVIVVYLDLSHYKDARKIGTELSSTPEQQKLLINIGYDLVKNNPTFKTMLAQLNRGRLTLGACQRKYDRRAEAANSAFAMATVSGNHFE